MTEKWLLNNVFLADNEQDMRQRVTETGKSAKNVYTFGRTRIYVFINRNVRVCGCNKLHERMQPASQPDVASCIAGCSQLHSWMQPVA